LLDRVVIAIRQSPDWAALADDFGAGRAIDPARYAPPRPIPAFPENIVDLIARWNAYSALDFFSVRRRLKEIAQATLRRIERGMVIPCAELAAALPDLRRDSALLFFSDDDDWFAPHIANAISPKDYAGADVLVFPLVRLGREQTGTFIHPALGATSKTPCAASFLPTVVQSPESFAETLGFYVREARTYTIPDELAWVREPLSATVSLFDEILTAAR